MLTDFVAWLLSNWHNYIDTNYQNNYLYEQTFAKITQDIAVWAFILLGLAMFFLIKSIFNRK